VTLKNVLPGKRFLFLVEIGAQQGFDSVFDSF